MFVSLPHDFIGTLPYENERFKVTDTDIEIHIKDSKTMMDLLGVLISIGRHDYNANINDIDASYWKEIARSYDISLFITKPGIVSLFEI